MDTPGMSGKVEKQISRPRAGTKKCGPDKDKTSDKDSNEENENEGNKCAFCGSAEDNERNFGKLIHQKKCGLTVHYFCMLFSSALNQRGKTEKQGILGFLIDDIKKELRRGAKLKCCYCKKAGATIGCALRKCGKKFHLHCGQKNETLNQFFGSFCVFCCDHRPKQKFAASPTDPSIVNCSICLSGIEPALGFHTLRASCCKNAWFHRKCVQDQALNAGYFFKCPLCNNKDLYESEMMTQGIYIPEQDASWEMEPDAFQDLLHRHDHCDLPICICPDGRSYDADGSRWEIILCAICGHQGCHVACAHLSFYRPYWECSLCKGILNNKKRPKQQKKTRQRKSDEMEPTSTEISTESPDSGEAPCPNTSVDMTSLQLVERIWKCQMELQANFRLLESLSNSEEEGELNLLASPVASASPSSASVSELKYVYISDSDEDVDVVMLKDQVCEYGIGSSGSDVDIVADTNLRLSPRDFPSPHSNTSTLKPRRLVEKPLTPETTKSESDSFIPEVEVKLPESCPTNSGITKQLPAEAEEQLDPPQIICYLLRHSLGKASTEDCPIGPGENYASGPSADCPVGPDENDDSGPSVDNPNGPEENLYHTNQVVCDPIIPATEQAYNSHHSHSVIIVNESPIPGISSPECPVAHEASSVKWVPVKVCEAGLREVIEVDENIQEEPDVIISGQLSFDEAHAEAIAKHLENDEDSNAEFTTIGLQVDDLLGHLDNDIEQGDDTESILGVEITTTGQECYPWDILKENHNGEQMPNKVKKRDESRLEKKVRKKRKGDGNAEECRRKRHKPKRSKIQRCLTSIELESNQALTEMADEFEMKLSVDSLPQRQESGDAPKSFSKDECLHSEASALASCQYAHESDSDVQIVGPLETHL